MWTAACDWLTERAGGIFALSLKRRVLVGAWQNITRDAIYSRARPALGQGDNEEHRSPPMTLKPRRPCWNALNTASVIWRCPRGKWYERLLGRAGKQLAAGRHLKSSWITMLSLIIDIRKANKQRRARSFPFSTVWGLLNINNSLISVRNSLSVFIYVLHRYMWKKTNRTGDIYGRVCLVVDRLLCGKIHSDRSKEKSQMRIFNIAIISLRHQWDKSKLTLLKHLRSSWYLLMKYNWENPSNLLSYEWAASEQ